MEQQASDAHPLLLREGVAMSGGWGAVKFSFWVALGTMIIAALLSTCAMPVGASP